MRLENLKILKCPTCAPPSGLFLEKDKAVIIDEYVERGDLICKNCGQKFPIRDGVPNLLPNKIQRYLEHLEEKKSLPKLPNQYQKLVSQIISMDKMSKAYREVVVDPHTAVEAAVQFEKYEDLLLREYLRKLIKRSSKDGKGIVFIEVGSGPGRYLVQLGGKIEANKDACKSLRENKTSKNFYSYDQEYEKHLKLMIGIDFSEGMIQSAHRWLKENRLHDLFLKDRIIMIKAAAQYLNLSFEDTPYQDSYKLVTCVFQTLGNQMERSLQTDLIKKMSQWAQPNGILFVSVFNRAVFQHYLNPYYKEIESTIGPIIHDEKALDEAILKTKWGVYSRWFDKKRLRELFREAGIKKVCIRTGGGFRRGLPLFTEEPNYLHKNIQKKVRERAIVGIVKI
jgi:uncharacterized protein YbaR (Trm112 family)/ubiquinone/menaquinone biosynthesis C-methylase UbiE